MPKEREALEKKRKIEQTAQDSSKLSYVITKALRKRSIMDRGPARIPNHQPTSRLDWKNGEKDRVQEKMHFAAVKKKKIRVSKSKTNVSSEGVSTDDGASEFSKANSTLLDGAAADQNLIDRNIDLYAARDNGVLNLGDASRNDSVAMGSSIKALANQEGVENDDSRPVSLNVQVADHEITHNNFRVREEEDESRDTIRDKCRAKFRAK